MEFDSSTLIIIGIFIVGIVYVFQLISKKNKTKFKEFNPIPIEEIYIGELDDKIKKFGKKIRKGKVLDTFGNIYHIDRYYETRGEMPIFFYNEDNNFYETVTDKKGNVKTNKYEFLILKLKSTKFLYRLFGIKKWFIIIRKNDENGNPIIIIEKRFKTINLPSNIDFFKYGNVWTECSISRDYLNNIGTLFELQAQQTHLINTPDRFIHLEKEQIKRENYLKTATELESGKYEQIKKAEDDIIT
jgi:hypothetical protein